MKKMLGSYLQNLLFAMYIKARFDHLYILCTSIFIIIWK